LEKLNGNSKGRKSKPEDKKSRKSERRIIIQANLSSNEEIPDSEKSTTQR
jgi:hypothetical protein